MRTVQTAGTSAKLSPSVVVPSALFVLTCAAWLLGAFIRSTAGAGSPLWVDETWTAAIAMQPGIADVLRHAYDDVNAPLYYVVMHAWVSLFGVSDASLRLPSLLFSLAAPALCLLPARSIPWNARLVWSALLALWVPAFLYAQEARCYSFLLFLGTASTIAAARLLEQPTLRRALVWSTLGAATCLTHYHALFLVGCQGLAYLARHRRRALATWPAVLPFALVLGWIVVHLPRIAAFADPQVVWYAPFTVADLAMLGEFVFGRPLQLLFVGLLAIATVTVSRPRDHAVDDDDLQAAGWIAAGSAAVGLMLVVALTLVRPTFTFRYATPFGPGILLAIALIAERARRRWPIAAIALVLLAADAAYKWNSMPPRQNYYVIGQASDDLMAAGVRDLVFLWDHPANAAEAPEQLDIVAGFFFRRAGVDVTVTPIKLGRDEDPNARLLAAAAGKPKPGVLWVYNTNERNVAARSRPPRIEKLAPDWRCHNYGHEAIGIVACHPAIPRAGLPR